MTKVHELVDTFDAANTALTYVGPATRDAGRLSLPLRAAATDPDTGQPIPQSSVRSTALLDFTDSELELELVRVPTSIRSRVTLSLSNPTTAAEFVAWQITAGVVRAIRYVGQQQTTGYSATFTTDLHRWLKIRHEQGAVVWSSSADGREWVDRAILLVPFPVTAMRVTVSSDLVELANPGDDDGASPLPALADNLNLAPPAHVGDPVTMIAADGNAPNIAVDVLPTVGKAGTFTLDRSRLDGPELIAWGEGLEWLNVVCDVQTVQIVRGSRGAANPTQRIADAGTCTLVITDTERRFDPTVNAAAIDPRTPIRVRAWAGTDSSAPLWSEVLYTGRINGDGISVAYNRTGPPTVTISASDLIGTLARWQSTGYDDPGVGAGDDLLDRVLRVFAELGINEGKVAPGSDSTYTATLAPTKLDQAWPAITEAVVAELGRLWCTSSNALSVHSRNSELTGTIRGTLSDWHGESVGDPEVHCCYVDPAVRYSADQIVNRAIGGRRGDTVTDPVQQDDETSQRRFDVIAVTNTSLALETAEQVAPWTRALVLGNTTPRVRVDQVSPNPATAPEAWQAVAATDLGDRWRMRLHPEQGATVMQTIGLIGIEQTITPAGWEIVWFTARAPEPGENLSGWFTLNLSKLDGGDVLAPFA